MDISRRTLLGGTAATLGSWLLDPVRALAAEVKRVRITDVESFRVSIPSGKAADPLRIYDYAISRVHTDAGALQISLGARLMT